MLNLFRFLAQFDIKDKVAVVVLAIASVVVFFFEFAALGSLQILFASMVGTDGGESVIISAFPSLSNLYGDVHRLAVFMAIIFLIKAVVTVFQNAVENLYYARLGLKYATNLYLRLVAIPYYSYLNMKSTFVIRLLDIEVPRAISGVRTLSLLFKEISNALVIFSFVFLFGDSDMFWGFLILMIPTVLFILFLRNVMRRLSADSFSSRVSEMNALEQTFKHFKTTRLYGNELFFYSKYELAIFTKERVEAIRRIIAIVPRPILEVSVISALAYVIFQDSGVTTSSELLAKVSVFAVAAIRAIPVVSGLSFCMNELRYLGPASEVVMDFERHLEEVSRNSGHASLMDAATCPESSSDKLPDFRKTQFESIIFENISFEYPGSYLGLKNLSFSICAKDFVLLVGPSGSGKSTVVDLITGLLTPSSGQIFINSIPCALDNARWRGIIGYVGQHTSLIEGSVADNIAYGVDIQDRDDEAVLSCMIRAGLDENGFSKRLVDSEGRGFSGGQVQRIAIARALYRSPEILILDEPTSALDEANAKLVWNTLETLTGVCRIIVTHDEKWISRVKNVVRLKSGGGRDEFA